MVKYSKLREKILAGGADANINFVELCGLPNRLGFEKRVRGNHHIFSRDGVVEIINLQPKNNMAKLYQVRQVRNILVKYHLGESNVD